MQLQICKGSRAEIDQRRDFYIYKRSERFAWSHVRMPNLRNFVL